MNIIDELLLSLDYKASVERIYQGAFQTAVMTRQCGLAATPHDPGPHHHRSPVSDAGLLLEKDVRTLAGMVRSESPSEAAIGMATINSLIEVDEQKCTETNAGDLIEEKGRGKRVAIVGHFPFVSQLYTVTGELWVIEKNPQEGDFPESEADRLLPLADVVGITGTAFTNHTIERLLSLCDPKAYVIILGGTTPLSSMLFDYGVNAISGTRVIEPDTVFLYLSQGATFRQLRGIQLLTMER